MIVGGRSVEWKWCWMLKGGFGQATSVSLLFWFCDFHQMALQGAKGLSGWSMKARDRNCKRAEKVSFSNESRHELTRPEPSKMKKKERKTSQAMGCAVCCK